MNAAAIVIAFASFGFLSKGIYLCAGGKETRSLAGYGGGIRLTGNLRRICSEYLAEVLKIFYAFPFYTVA
jgi:hypothetical protein